MGSVVLGLPACLSCLTPQTAHAKLVQEEVRVPVVVQDGFGKEFARDMVVVVFVEDTTPTPRPVMVLGHGRAVDAHARAALNPAAYSANAKWFARIGFLVALPVRIGYGATGGDDAEDTGPCSRKNYPPGYAVAARQLLKTLEVMRQRPDASKDRAIIVGQSFGGATAITIAAQNPPGVQATINFAGGGGGNPLTKPQDPCAPWALKQMFADYGKTARIPTLWIYTENDMYFGPRLPKEWFDAYVAAGGKGDYMRYPPQGKDGHPLFTRTPGLWRPRVLEFLQTHGYPNLRVPEPETGSRKQTGARVLQE
jgi:dienelactone hydrolase